MAFLARSLGCGCAGAFVIGIPRSRFTRDSTADDVTEGLDLSGQVALITGCTSGTGLESARVLALRGAHVLATGRTREKVDKACAGMRGRITSLELELEDLNSASRCAAVVAEMGLTPDIVICNAGMQTFGDREMVDGIEKMFLVNYLSHFVLVTCLLPGMLERGSGRLVHVSSNSAYKRDPLKQVPATGIDFDSVHGRGPFDTHVVYAQSKLANALFSYELSHRLRGTGIVSNALHPGSVYTNISHSAPESMRQAIKEYAPNLKTPAQGAATQIYVATSAELEGVSGAFFDNCNPVEVDHPHFLEDKALAEELWEVSEELAAVI